MVNESLLRPRSGWYVDVGPVSIVVTGAVVNGSLGLGLNVLVRTPAALGLGLSASPSLEDLLEALEEVIVYLMDQVENGLDELEWVEVLPDPGSDDQTAKPDVQ